MNSASEGRTSQKMPRARSAEYRTPTNFAQARRPDAPAYNCPTRGAAASADALPSWNDGPSKRAIVAFVDKVTTAGSRDCVAPAERIATFDNDGTLWSEQPVYFQVLFVYQPMLELLAYLRANGFKTFIVSGGGQEFMRPWTERVYGIPPEQVVGSGGELRWEMRGDGPVLVKLAKIALVDDKEGKPVGIQRFIGRRPILAFGNSDGDLQMLQWTTAGTGARFAGLVHHTDDAREFAYDRTSHFGRLDKAWDEGKARGWTIVDMKSEWRRVYPFDP